MILFTDCHWNSRKLFAVDNNIHFLWSRSAELGSEKWLAASPGEKKTATWTFLVSLMEYWYTDPKQTCQRFFFLTKKYQRIQKVWLSLPPYPHTHMTGIRDKHQEWVKSEPHLAMRYEGERLCRQAVLDQVGWLPPTPTLDGAAVFHWDSRESDLGSADVSGALSSLVTEGMLPRKSSGIIVKLALE